MQMIEFFREEEGYTLRAATIDGQEWFAAKDVCDILEIKNPTQAVGSLDDDEHMTCPMEYIGQVRHLTCINESGLYALIFRSRKPKAREFRRWVTAEVLPAIRRTGSYSLAGQSAPPNPIAHPAVQFIEVIDALRMRGASTEKALYSVGNLFQSALAGAYQSNRQVLPMTLPPPPDPATLPLLTMRTGRIGRPPEHPDLAEHILATMGEEPWAVGKLQQQCGQDHGIPRSTFYRGLHALREAGRVTQNDKGLWTAVKGGAQ
jgi:hypothetical protein